MTFVRAKLALESLTLGQVLNIKLRDGEPLHNVPRALRDHGHEILGLRRMSGNIFELVVCKRR